MKKKMLSLLLGLVAGFSMVSWTVAQYAERMPSVRPADEISKSDKGGTAAIDVDVDVAFSRNSGQTITDENGTYYNVYGWTFYEPKVYPPEYWGVFPLYFFNDTVGVTLSVANNGDDKAKIRLREECYCLNTDGTSGAELMAPNEQDAAVDGLSVQEVDASFVCGYSPEADSGLDRFLVKVMEPGEPDANNGAHVIAGDVNINPNNNTDNEFVLTLPDGSTITRDDLHEGYAGYSGSASRIHIRPKGNGNQNGLVVDGKQYTLKNSDTYDIIASGMTVTLWNDGNSDGKAMGKWWLTVSASGATILTQDGNAPLILLKEAVFCPPEFNGELSQAVNGAVE